MKWRRVRNRDVIDVRGRRGAAGGGRLPIPRRLALPGGLGAAGLLVFLALQVLGGGGGGFDLSHAVGPGAAPPSAENPAAIPPAQDPQRRLKDFSVYVFTDAQRTWAEIFGRSGERYDNAELVLYSGGVTTDGCGSASSAVGPFYCPADRRIYLDLSFYGDMETQLGAAGDFAWAYVIAHEVGHHVQLLSGTSEEVDRLSREDPDEANELSVRQELQADCYAGVWGSTVYAEGDLEAGDLDEAFAASEAVGDDRLQREATGRVDPDSFTHGTSEQRREWFERGYEAGEPGDCDTFSVDDL